MAFIRIGEDRFKSSSVSAYCFTLSPSSSKFSIKLFFGRRFLTFTYKSSSEVQAVVDYLDGVLGFIRIIDDRFRPTSVSAYSFSPVRSPNTGMFYVKVLFGQRERLFAFSTVREAQRTVAFLDELLKCKEA